MRLGITGLAMAGRTTVFEALTRQPVEAASRAEDRLAVVRVPDERVDALAKVFSPRKVIYAQVEYLLPAAGATKRDQSPWLPVKGCDALIHVLRNHGSDRNPLADFRAVDQELILSDLMQVEKRLERLELDQQRGRKMNPEEHALLLECRGLLEGETPLRHRPGLAEAKLLRGFALLSAKPMLLVFNNEDNDAGMPDLGGTVLREKALVLQGKLEQELTRMTPEEAAEFMAEFKIRSSAMDRMIRLSYEALQLVSFFTVGADEVRAWTVPRDTPAEEAAGTIHTDLQKGFIRAEVVSYADFTTAGSMAEARRRGTVRLEGRTYSVADGDIITVRFNV
jgi:GTP-binding protein YchF